MSKRVKIEGIKGEPLNMSNFWADSIKRKEEEQERERKEREQEEERINKIEFPRVKNLTGPIAHKLPSVKPK